MTSCSQCGSYAINHHLHGRDGSDPELCDVCYWRKRAQAAYQQEGRGDLIKRLLAHAAAAQSAEIEALEALSRAHQTAMVQTLKARIPECAEFGGIAQDLDFVVTALRERLGEGEQK